MTILSMPKSPLGSLIREDTLYQSKSYIGSLLFSVTDSSMYSVLRMYASCGIFFGLNGIMPVDSNPRTIFSFVRDFTFFFLSLLDVFRF